MPRSSHAPPRDRWSLHWRERRCIPARHHERSPIRRSVEPALLRKPKLCPVRLPARRTRRPRRRPRAPQPGDVPGTLDHAQAGARQPIAPARGISQARARKSVARAPHQQRRDEGRRTTVSSDEDIDIGGHHERPLIVHRAPQLGRYVADVSESAGQVRLGVDQAADERAR
jgi:hypothetical protein